MLISVLICTYNRSGSIPDILENLLNQRPNKGFDYEAIIIDNNSRDQTKQTIEAYAPKFNGKLRYFFEPKQGKPFALNLGINKALGDIIAFTDDDCLVEDDYLISIYEALQKYGEEIGVLGGKIIPRWNKGHPPDWLKPFFENQVDSIPWSGNDKPAWLDRFFQGPVGVLDYGTTPFVIDYAQGIRTNDLFYGGNIVIRKNLLDLYGYFNCKKRVAEDSDICLRMFKAGVKGVYLPQMTVYHKADIREITPHFYYRWWYLQGLYMDLKFDLEQKYLKGPLKTRLYLLRETWRWFIKSLLVRPVIQKAYYRAMASFTCGQLVQISKRDIYK